MRFILSDVSFSKSTGPLREVNPGQLIFVQEKKNFGMEITAIIAAAFFASVLTFFSGFGLGTILLPVFAIFFPVDIGGIYRYRRGDSFTCRFYPPHGICHPLKGCRPPRAPVTDHLSNGSSYHWRNHRKQAAEEDHPQIYSDACCHHALSDSNSTWNGVNLK